MNNGMGLPLLELLTRLTERNEFPEVRGNASGDRRMREYEAKVIGNRDTGYWSVETADALTTFNPATSEISYSNAHPAKVNALTHLIPTEAGLLFPLRLPIWGRRSDTWEPIMIEDNLDSEQIVYLRGKFDRSIAASVVMDTKYCVAKYFITPHEGHALRDYKPAS